MDTISSLAAEGAADRWLMTAALCGVGACHLITGYGLRGYADAGREAKPLDRGLRFATPAGGYAGRALLMAGGLATVLVALLPQPRDGSSAAHAVSAALAFGALAAWPLPGWRRAGPVRPAASAAAGVVLLGLVGWFAVTLGAGGPVGLAERVAAGAQSTWPLIAVLVARRGHP